jgi:Tol biopolymer transport system component
LPAIDNKDEWFDVWSWSPDGNWLAGRRISKASAETKGLSLFSLESQTHKSLLNFGHSARWLNDNKRMVFLNEGKLHWVDLVSGESRLLLELPLRITGFSLSPDGKTVHFTGATTEADLWMITKDFEQ